MYSRSVPLEALVSQNPSSPLGLVPPSTPAPNFDWTCVESPRATARDECSSCTFVALVARNWSSCRSSLQVRVDSCQVFSAVGITCSSHGRQSVFGALDLPECRRYDRTQRRTCGGGASKTVAPRQSLGTRAAGLTKLPSIHGSSPPKINSIAPQCATTDSSRTRSLRATSSENRHFSSQQAAISARCSTSKQPIPAAAQRSCSPCR